MSGVKVWFNHYSVSYSVVYSTRIKDYILILNYSKQSDCLCISWTQCGAAEAFHLCRGGESEPTTAHSEEQRATMNQVRASDRPPQTAVWTRSYCLLLGCRKSRSTVAKKTMTLNYFTHFCLLQTHFFFFPPCLSPPLDHIWPRRSSGVEVLV